MEHKRFTPVMDWFYVRSDREVIFHSKSSIFHSEHVYLLTFASEIMTALALWVAFMSGRSAYIDHLNQYSSLKVVVAVKVDLVNKPIWGIRLISEDESLADEKRNK